MSITWPGDSSVTLTVEAAFGVDPLTAVPSYTDITSDVRSFTTERGRDNTADRIRTGKARVILDNNTGDYTPFNTAGANTPDIIPMVPFRISAAYTVSGAFALGDDVDTNGILDIGTVPIFTGFVEAWEPQWRDGTDMTTEVRATDGIKLWNLFTVTNRYGPAEIRGVISTMLQDAGWPAEWIDGYSGNVPAQSHAPTGSALTALRRLEDTDGGELFIQADGHSMFHPTAYRGGLTAIDTFGDGGGEYRYEHDPDFGFDDHQIWNSISVLRRGGTTQTSSDATSISTYVERSLRRSDTLHTSDAIALGLADDLKARYKDPTLRLDSFTFVPATDPANLWPVALGYDISQKLKVKRVPATGDTIDLDVFLERISHTVGEMSWETEFTVSQYA